MYIEISTINDVYMFHDVKEIIYHTDSGNKHFHNHSAIEYTGQRNAITVITPDQQVSISYQPFVTKLVC